jgi:hypothetical protein
MKLIAMRRMPSVEAATGKERGINQRWLAIVCHRNETVAYSILERAADVDVAVGLGNIKVWPRPIHEPTTHFTKCTKEH